MNGDGVMDQPPAEWLDGPAGPDAPTEATAIYDDIAAHLRVPYLGPFWRALAWDPVLLTRLWIALAPILAGRAFEREAAALRRIALIEEAVTMPSHQAFKADLVRSEIDFEMRERIGNYNAAVHYALPKTLLAGAWLLASGSASASSVDTTDRIPRGVAAGAVAVSPVPPQQVRGRLAELLEEIPRAHGHPIADEYYRALGRLPDYLNAAWNAIKPLVRDEPYDERGRQLTRLASAAIARLPNAHTSLASIVEREQDAARLRAVARYFVLRHLPDMLIDVALIKGLTEGPERAQASPFDVRT